MLLIVIFSLSVLLFSQSQGNLRHVELSYEGITGYIVFSKEAIIRGRESSLSPNMLLLD